MRLVLENEAVQIFRSGHSAWSRGDL